MKKIKIEINIPADGLARVKSFWPRRRETEKLRLVYDHPASHYRVGVLLVGRGDEMLDGATFQALVDVAGAWIGVDSPETKKRVEQALFAQAIGVADKIVVLP